MQEDVPGRAQLLRKMSGRGILDKSLGCIQQSAAWVVEFEKDLHMGLFTR
jgi:hypothetical protein